MNHEREAEAGILAWMNTIRFQIAMAPVRQYFEDQVQEQGFDFLDDYWANIVAGPQQDSIVELLKTPGRKRISPTKPGVLTRASEMRNDVSFSLEVDVFEKENVRPVNNLYGALLQAKSDVDSSRGGSRPQAQGRLLQRSIPPGSALPATSQDATSLPRIAITAEAAEHGEAYLSERDLPGSRLEQNLSAIAEDDELERSRNSMELPRPSTAASADGISSSVASRPMDISIDSTVHTVTDATTSWTDTHNSFPSGSRVAPPHRHSSDTYTPGAPAANSHTQISTPDDCISANPSDTTTQPFSDYHTAPLAQAHDHSPQPRGPHPPLPTSSIYTPAVSNQPSTHYFPSFPAPMPFRKSLHASQIGAPAVSGSGGSTVGRPAVGGKRTSWLAKAREAKALDFGSSKAGSGSVAFAEGLDASTPLLKRKSEEMKQPIFPSEERRSKMAKFAATQVDTDSKAVTRMGGNEEERADPTKQRLRLDPLEPAAVESAPPLEQSPSLMPTDVLDLGDDDDDVLDGFKRMVQGLGARAGKSMGKSLGGGAAVSALAKAKAAAEARVAKRAGDGLPPVPPHVHDTALTDEKKRTEPLDSFSQTSAASKRLSVSDLVTTSEATPPLIESANPSVTLAPPATDPLDGDDRKNPAKMANSSQVIAIKSPPPHEPVFRPIGRVFAPPTKVTQPPAKEDRSNAGTPAPSSNVFSSMPAFLPLLKPQRDPPLLSATSTFESLESYNVFDGDDHIPAWVPRTQDTEQSTVASQLLVPEPDDDDSWPLEGRLAERNAFFGIDEDASMTWSTSTDSDNEKEHADNVRANPDALDMDMDDVDEDMLSEDGLEDLARSGKPTVGLVGSTMDRNAGTQSQLSMNSSASSQQSRLGILGQASKFVSSVLGGRKVNPQVKSLQLAAAAAKKQQEEADKKAARLKEMENRRQLASQRKAEEEKARAAEEQRRVKEEGQKRKKERDEHTDKRPLRAAPKKGADEDNTMKRKLANGTEKKPEVKKPPSKENTTTSKIAKPNLNSSSSATKPNPTKSALKQPTASSTSTTANTAVGPSSSRAGNPNDSRMTRAQAAAPASTKGKGNALTQDEDIAQPSQVLQGQMAARAKAQMKAAAQPDIPTESIELPDINSEYSDSEDEDRPRTFDPPEWAQSPELRQALQQQSTVNPDDIFGEIRPLRMDEIFRTRQSRFRARTSSANWAGADRLTQREELEYARRMGFR